MHTLTTAQHVAWYPDIPTNPTPTTHPHSLLQSNTAHPIAPYAAYAVCRSVTAVPERSRAPAPASSAAPHHLPPEIAHAQPSNRHERVCQKNKVKICGGTVSYTHLRAHETEADL
eukprot:406106-Rhodomonas_salina.1